MYIVIVQSTFKEGSDDQCKMKLGATGRLVCTMRYITVYLHRARLN